MSTFLPEAAMDFEKEIENPSAWKAGLDKALVAYRVETLGLKADIAQDNTDSVVDMHANQNYEAAVLVLEIDKDFLYF